MTLWLIDRNQSHYRLTDSFALTFYVSGPEDRLVQLRDAAHRKTKRGAQCLHFISRGAVTIRTMPGSRTYERCHLDSSTDIAPYSHAQSRFDAHAVLQGGVRASLADLCCCSCLVAVAGTHTGSCPPAGTAGGRSFTSLTARPDRGAVAERTGGSYISHAAN